MRSSEDIDRSFPVDQLFFSSFLLRYEYQSSLSPNSYPFGSITIRALVQGSHLRVEVLNARHLKPIDVIWREKLDDDCLDVSTTSSYAYGSRKLAWHYEFGMNAVLSAMACCRFQRHRGDADKGRQIGHAAEHPGLRMRISGRLRGSTKINLQEMLSYAGQQHLWCTVGCQVQYAEVQEC